jgi:hypothetical protein
VTPDPQDTFAAGAATDAQGRATRDPSDNVLDLVHAETKRADDLREMKEGHRLELAAKDSVIEEWKFRFYEERDRRLTEVAVEREKALKIKDDGDKEARRIKEEGDKEARLLSREAQRDRDDAAAKVAELVTSQATRNEGAKQTRSDQKVNMNLLIGFGALLLTALGVATAVILALN